MFTSTARPKESQKQETSVEVGLHWIGSKERSPSSAATFLPPAGKFFLNFFLFTSLFFF